MKTDANCEPSHQLQCMLIMLIVMIFLIGTIPIATDGYVVYGHEIPKNTARSTHRIAGVTITPTSDGTNSRGGYGVGNPLIWMPGVALYFLTITNAGTSGADTFELSSSGSLEGWGVSFHENDTYLTPYVDTDNDGTIDTGTMAPGAGKEIVVWVSNPYNEADLVTDTTTVTATSSVDGSVSASSTLSTICRVAMHSCPERAGGCYGTVKKPDGITNADDHLVICYNSGSGEAINDIAGSTGLSGTTGYWYCNVGATYTGVYTGDIAWIYIMNLTNGDKGYDTCSLIDSGGLVNCSQTVETSLDLQITNITFEPPSPVDEGTSINITATITNLGTRPATNVVVKFYDGDPEANGTYLGIDAISYPDTIGVGGTANFTYIWDTTGHDGAHDIYVKIDPDGYLSENNESNNKACKNLTVLPPTLMITYIHASRTENVSYSRPTIISANATGYMLQWNVTVYESGGVTVVEYLTDELASNSGASYCNMSVTWTPQVHYTDEDYIIGLSATDTANNTAQENVTVAVYNMKEKINEILVQDQYGSPADPNNIVPGNQYYFGASITNLEETDTQTLHIIQIKNAGSVVVFITTASGNLPPGYTFNLTSSWNVPSDLAPGVYTIEAFAWNHWVSQSPETWEALARKETMTINVVGAQHTS